MAMTRLLEKAFAEAALLPDEDQDALAAALLEELESERRWDELFASSPEVLQRLADEALAEHRAGNTEPLDRLLESVTPANLHSEAGLGGPQGIEGW